MSIDRWMNKQNVVYTHTQHTQWSIMPCCALSLSCLTLCNPTACSLPGSSVHGDSPGKNTGMGCHALLQGIFRSQGSNPGLPHCTQILYHLRHQGSPWILEWVAYPISRGFSWPRNWTQVSFMAGRFFTSWAARKAPMEHYAAIQRSKILIHTITWMNLKNMLSGSSQTQKAAYCVISFTWNIQNRPIHRYKGRLVVARGSGKRGMGSDCLMGMGVRLGIVKKFWYEVVVIVAQHCECTHVIGL